VSKYSFGKAVDGSFGNIVERVLGAL